MTTTIDIRARSLRNLKSRHRAAALALGALWLLTATPAAVAQAVSADTLLAHVRYLASDALAGREAGDPGADSAAAYVASRFGAYGLEPLGDDGYRQPFQVTTTVTIAPESRLVLRTSRGTLALALYREWLPFSFSGSGATEGPVTRAGYGLSAGDYSGARPGVVLLRGGAPPDANVHGSGVDASARRKATTAREQGAAAVLITVSRIEVPQAGESPNSVGIPVIQILERDELAGWLDAPDLQVTLDARVAPVVARTYNVVGKIPGSDPQRAAKFVVIGAHYDHLGLGGPGSLAPDSVTPHNGADDNASGTALLLGLAQYFAGHPEARPARSLAFVAFSAEEMGLLGSEHFVSHSPIPLESISAMVNFDMVGRLREGKAQVFGTETAREFAALLDTLDAQSPLTLSRIGDGYGPSDQTSFYARRIPVLHLFTGTHSEYHRPEDDWQLINAAGMAELADFSIALVRQLGDWPGELTLVEQQRPPAAAGGGYGPYLGTIPDFGEVEGGGLRISGVRAGSPAEAAGLRAGDVVIRFGAKDVLNIYDYTYALREHAPGDTVVIKVRRDGEVLEVTAVLGRRE
jgi:hypothetical protein